MQIVLIRHGESFWNVEQRFTGWTDIDLTPKGLEEARAAGRLLRQKGFEFDIVYTSLMRRAIRTAWTILDELDLLWVPAKPTWLLNERHFGALEGLTFDQARREYGAEWVDGWRQDYSRVPPLAEAPPSDRRYADVAELPRGESMLNAIERIRPFFEGEILAKARSGHRVLVVCHGNTIRALDEMLRNGIGERMAEVPTATPLFYELSALGGQFST